MRREKWDKEKVGREKWGEKSGAQSGAMRKVWRER